MYHFLKIETNINFLFANSRLEREFAKLLNFNLNQNTRLIGLQNLVQFCFIYIHLKPNKTALKERLPSKTFDAG